MAWERGMDFKNQVGMTKNWESKTDKTAEGVPTELSRSKFILWQTHRMNFDFPTLARIGLVVIVDGRMKITKTNNK